MAGVIAFMIVSTLNFIGQVRILVRFLWPAAIGRHSADSQITVDTTTDVYRALVRTAKCRVIAAGLYVGVGIYAIYVGRVESYITSQITFGVFCLVQVMWQLNAHADARLRRRL